MYVRIYLSFFSICLVIIPKNNRNSLVVSFSQRISPFWIRTKLGVEQYQVNRIFYQDLAFWYIQNLKADLRIDYVQRVENYKSTRNTKGEFNLGKCG